METAAQETGALKEALVRHGRRRPARPTAARAPDFRTMPDFQSARPVTAVGTISCSSRSRTPDKAGFSGRADGDSDRYEQVYL